MKPVHVSLPVFLLMTALFVPPAWAQQDDEAEHDALRELKAVFEEAVNTNNLELLRPHMDENFSVVTFTNRHFTDFNDFQKQWQKSREKMLQGGSYHVELLPERSRIVDDIAITMGDSESLLVTGGGDEFEFSSRWTAVCRKVDGQWKISRVHSSLDPFFNPMVQHGARQAVIRYTLIAAVVALVLGGLLGWLAARRKTSSTPTPS